jgi:polar amino acid transport system substrate-binding protein
MAFNDDAGEPAGFEVDIARALAAELGVAAEFHQVADVEAIVGDAKAGTYEAVMASIRITTEREGEVDFVRYLGPVGMGILVLSGNSSGIRLLEDMCGRSIATTAGIADHEFYITETTNDFCAANPIDVRQFPDYAAATEAVRTGEVDAQFAEDPAIAYAAANSSGEIQQALVGFDSTHYGIGVSKESPQLRVAILQAFESVRTSGEYAAIIAKWALEDFAYTR